VIKNLEKPVLIVGVDKYLKKAWESERTIWMNNLMENNIRQEDFPTGLINPMED